SSYHGVDTELRMVLEPLFIKYGVDVVFSGHEHYYERLKPVNGVTYFTSGAAGRLHRRSLTQPAMAAAGFAAAEHFMPLEINGDDMFFRAIARSGKIVDAGAVRRNTQDEEKPSTAMRLQVPRLRDALVDGAPNQARFVGGVPGGAEGVVPLRGTESG